MSDSSPMSQVRWIELPTTRDDRGALTAIEGGADIPFSIQRIFYMHSVVAERGGHAHRDTHQVAIALGGRVDLDLDDGESRMSLALKEPTHGLYLPPMIFVTLRNFSAGATCLVLASDHYDRGRSLRTYDEF